MDSSARGRATGRGEVRMRDKIVELYGTPALKRSALGLPGGAEVFERVLSGKGYRTVLEIGTYRGASAAAMSQYCERVITFDLKRGRLESLGESCDREAFWSSLGISNIELRLVANDEEKKRQIDSLAFDLAFIDGGHDAESVAFDFAITKRCGKVLFHDADDNRLREHKPNAPNHVFEFIDALPKSEVEFIGIFALWQK